MSHRINRQMLAEATEELYNRPDSGNAKNLLRDTVNSLDKLWTGFLAPVFQVDAPPPFMWNRSPRSIVENITDTLGIRQNIVLSLDQYERERRFFEHIIVSLRQKTAAGSAGKIVMAGFALPDTRSLSDPRVIDRCIASMASQAMKDSSMVWLTEYESYGVQPIDSVLNLHLPKLEGMVARAFLVNNFEEARHNADDRTLDQAKLINSLLRNSGGQNPLEMVRGYLRMMNWDSDYADFGITHIYNKMQYMKKTGAVYRQNGGSLAAVSETYK